MVRTNVVLLNEHVLVSADVGVVQALHDVDLPHQSLLLKFTPLSEYSLPKLVLLHDLHCIPLALCPVKRLHDSGK